MHLRPWFGFDWSDLSEWDGPAGFVVFPVSAKETGSAWILLGKMESSGNPPWAAGEAYFDKRGYRKSTETLGEAKLAVFTNPASRTASQPAYLTAKSLFIAADSAAAAKTLWKSMDGKNPLASSPDFRELGKAMESGGSEASAIRWWMRPLELYSNLRGGESATSSARDWLAMAKRQGGDAFSAAGGRIIFPPSGAAEVEFQGEILIKRPLAKAARILEFQTAARTPLPDWLGDDLASLSFWGWDCPNSVKAFGNYYDDMNEPGPQGEGLFRDMLSALLEDPEGPQVDLAKDLFPYLGPAVFQAADRKGRSAKGEIGGARTLLALQCRDRAKVEKVLTKFYADDKDVKRVVSGVDRLWTIGPGRSLFVESTHSSIGEVRAVLLTPKELIVASEPEILSERSSTAPLSKSAAYKAVSEWWKTNDADRAVSCSFLQAGVWLEGPYGIVKKNAKAAEADWTAEALRFALTGSRQPAADLPVDMLPDYESIRRRLMPLGTLLKDNSRGWEIRGGVLRGAAASP